MGKERFAKWKQGCRYRLGYCKSQGLVTQVRSLLTHVLRVDIKDAQHRSIGNDVLRLASIRRMMACLLYELLLLLGVLSLGFMVPHLLLGLLMQVSAPNWVVLLHLVGLVGFYFVWYWVHGGQTLAMQTWKLRVVRCNGQTLGVWHAIGRYILASMWVVPAVMIDYLLRPVGATHILIFFLCMLFFAPLTALLNRQHIFLHDRLAHTRIIFVD
ncbi:MAG: RDD family protein [Ottowia sp.]|nr:RDD family protein [Ottowia sp.]